MDGKNSSIMLIGSGLLFAMGSFAAWATASGVSISGVTGGDGWFTLLAGIALLALGYLSYSGRTYPSWLAWVALAVGAAVALINLFDIMGIDGVQVGLGLWLMVAGIVVGLLGLAMGRKTV